MPTELTDGFKTRFRNAIINGLPSLEIHEGHLFRPHELMAFTGEIDKAFPAAKHKELDDLLGKSPVTRYIFDSLHTDLLSRFERDELERYTQITDFDGYQDIEAVADRLVRGFERLPAEYRVLCPLPAALQSLIPYADEETRVSDEITLRRVKVNDDGLRAFHGRVWEPGLDWAPPEGAPEDSFLCVEVTVNGYLGVPGSGETYDDIESLIGSFFGLLLASNVVMLGPQAFLPASFLLSASENLGKEWVWHWSYFQSSPLRENWSSLKLGTGQDLNTLGKAVSESRRKEVIYRISTVLSQPEGSEDLSWAAKWFFDVAKHTGDPLSFVKLMVVMEILLGHGNDHEQTGLAELMASRCAYLVGGSFSERADIIDQFKKLYSIRSKIVHRGRGPLAKEYWKSYFDLRLLCGRVICEELRLLWKDDKRQQEIDALARALSGDFQ